MEPLPTYPTQNRSAFITGFAWSCIILTGFMIFVSFLQNLLFTLFSPIEQIQHDITFTTLMKSLPAAVQFIFVHTQFFIAAFFVLSVTMFVSSVALLKRKNWARVAFILFLGLGIASNIASVFLQKAFISAVAQLPLNAPPEVQAFFGPVTTVMVVFSALIALVFSALFAWLIKRLLSQEIRAEFQPNGR